jgi:creatinine amidohydrolase/Fe(II)-dependent formamide hydrolase-like protein/7-cyano-7-deazaguanine synthase in queuosine biosynthesis
LVKNTRARNKDQIGDPLEVLGVIQRLEIGPPVIEKRRITTPYKLTRNGEQDTTELVYRFEEDLLIPGDRDFMNLASMISVQVALNYGLFCDEIIFNGVFDQIDRRFIIEMAQNTARETFVKKILEDNPFLQGEITEIPPIKRQSYLRAKVIFNDEKGGLFHDLEDTFLSWKPHPGRYAVLSSGGKDSLLSFGLLREMGYECHPVFLNESGRHWFTALNAYRYFAENIPNTARVWNNSDRVFAWMLRHLPFIRKDFADVRSDEYPIRLWTVAVFLFGALPVLKKRGIGRVVIGDEFDTTQRLSYKGITHYDGLYDQSRYFDDALTRYFHRKKWEISQFSILRPLSELLIEKILVERYPDLQDHQTSCHATHKDEDRISPCGRCEKCRRIVGMLMAIDADPTRCGYAPEQVNRCMKDLVSKGIKQERTAVEHLGHLLTGKGLINRPFIGSVEACERPSIMKLRFDPEKSPLEGIPVDLRGPLYRIYLGHANGATRKSGRTWMDFDPIADPALNRPYPFDPPAGSFLMDQCDPERSVQHGRDYLLGELTWPEAEKRFKEVDVALLPVGAIEQHGPHLPLDSDAFDADYLARHVAESCSEPKPFVLPPVSYGVSYHHEDFSGTISISPETLSKIVYDIGMSAVRHGITKLVIINGHGGNGPALHFAAQMLNRDAHIFTCVDTGETSDPDIYAMAETPNDVHAGEIETSTTLASRPHLVRTFKAQKFIPRFSSRYLDFTSKRSVGWYAHTSKISPLGVLGDPTKGTREKGERMWQVMIKHLVEFVEDLKSMSLDEIYQKRY